MVLRGLNKTAKMDGFNANCKCKVTEGVELAIFEADAKRKEKSGVGRGKIQWISFGEDRLSIWFAKRRP